MQTKYVQSCGRALPAAAAGAGASARNPYRARHRPGLYRARTCTCGPGAPGASAAPRAASPAETAAAVPGARCPAELLPRAGAAHPASNWTPVIVY